MRIEILSFSARGKALGERLAAWFAQRGDQARASRCKPGGLAPWTAEHFGADGLIFVGSCGIAVRAIAPYVTSKVQDPAVVVVDELGTFSVSLLSGHLGGANRLAEEVARAVDATPVITTATDRNGLLAVDSWARDQGLAIANPEHIKKVSARLLAGEKIKLYSEIPLEGRLPHGVSLTETPGDVIISHRTLPETTALHLVPPVLTLGVGCRKGISQEALEESFTAFVQESHCHPAGVKQVCTIDLKAQEKGLLAFCRNHGFPLVTYQAEDLLAVPGTFTESAFVKSITGVDNVCERSALLGSGPKGRILRGKTIYPGITMALAIEPGTFTLEG